MSAPKAAFGGGLAGALAGMASAIGGVSTTVGYGGAAPPPLPGAAASTFSGSAPDLSAMGLGGPAKTASVTVPGTPSARVFGRETPSTHKVGPHSSSSTSSGGHGWFFIALLLLGCCCCAAAGGFFLWNKKYNKKVKQRVGAPDYHSDYNNFAGSRDPRYQEVPMDPVMRPGSESMANVGPGMQEQRAFQTNLVPTDSIPSQTPWNALQNMAPSPVQPAVMQEVQAQPVSAPSMVSQPPVGYPVTLPQAGSQYTTVNTTLGQTVSVPPSASMYTAPQTAYSGYTAQYNAPKTVFPGGSAQAPSTQLTGAPPYSAAQAPAMTTMMGSAPVMTSMQVQGYTQPMTVAPATQPMMQSMQVSGAKPARYVS